MILRLSITLWLAAAILALLSLTGCFRIEKGAVPVTVNIELQDVSGVTMAQEQGTQGDERK